MNEPALMHKRNSLTAARGWGGAEAAREKRPHLGWAEPPFCLGDPHSFLTLLPLRLLWPTASWEVGAGLGLHSLGLRQKQDSGSDMGRA